MRIGNIECDDNEKIVYTIADDYCTCIENVYKKENREFNREHYIVYFTYLDVYKRQRLRQRSWLGK